MEGTYRSIYKKNAQRDGCLISNLRFTIGYTNLLPEHRRLSPFLQSSRFSVISGLDPERNPMGNSRGEVAREHVQDQYGKSNRRIASKSKL